MITGKINVSKINKDKLFPGAKGKYLDIVLIETPNSEYGDYMICEGTTKEERDKGVKGTILGNAKIVKSRKQDSRPARTSSAPAPAAGEPPTDDDVPF